VGQELEFVILFEVFSHLYVNKLQNDF